jgi:hypothetical protein
MGLTQDLGTRVELVSMDPHFHDITIGLYRQNQDGRTRYLVHTYSHEPGAGDRIAFILRVADTMAGLERGEGWFGFPCGASHQAAARRVFLEACKLAPTSAIEARPLSVLDKKSGRTITVKALGSGKYEVTPDGAEDTGRERVNAVSGGLKKLAELESVEDSPGVLRFPCGQSHHLLIGLLLPRALNVRAILREEESAGSRGQLAAPSQQR